jgi:integrase
MIYNTGVIKPKGSYSAHSRKALMETRVRAGFILLKTLRGQTECRYNDSLVRVLLHLHYNKNKEDLTMAVYKDEKRKTWYCRTSYRDDTGNVKVMMKRGFATKRAALDYEDQFRKRDTLENEGSMLYSELFETFLLNKRGTANEDTIQRYRFIAKDQFGSIMSKKVSRISPNDYLNIRVKIVESTVSKHLKNQTITLLRSIARFGNDIYNLPNNAKVLKKVSNTSDDQSEMVVWSEVDFEQFIKFVDNYLFKSFFIFLFRTGLRRGEAKALLKSDISGDVVTVDKSIRSYINGNRPLKTQSSKRKIRLDSITLEVLAPLLEQPGRFLFGNEEPVGNSTLQRYFTAGIKKCNEALILENKPPIPVIRIHDLRHSHATILINKGANIVAVSRRLGHSDISMTLKVYTHLLKETEDQLIQILEKK